MIDFICPNCRGGFPEPVNDARVGETQCPWCGQSLDGEYEHEYPRAISRVKKDDNDREELGGPLYQRLFGWLE